MTALQRKTGIIDCHLHVIGDGKDFPYAANRAYDPPYAPLEQLLSLHERLGVSHAVLVQVSVYGTDNGLLLDTLWRYPARFRGVAVTGPSPRDGELAVLRDAGVVGLRLNLMHGGGPGLSQLRRYADVCRDGGFHLQLYLDGRLLADLRQEISSLNVPVVFDHFGGIPAEMAIDPKHSVVDALTGLLSDGAWVKLSAPYRVSSLSSGNADVVSLGRQLLRAAPTRCVWGSDWPHVATDKVIQEDQLLKIVEDITLDQNERTAILFDNAKQLYGFEVR